MTEPLRIVRVALGERSYDVLIGPQLVANAGSLIAARVQCRRVAVVTDDNVARHHLEPLRWGLAGHMDIAGVIEVTHGEASKNFGQLTRVCEAMLDLGLERGDVVLALGGGVIGDLAGFAASIFRRGVRFVQIPTTLLAQVDSSVGGKTGINAPQGKNLIGAFHQPSLVLADTDVLATLPARELRAGYAEVVKYGLIGQADFFDLLDQHLDALLALDNTVLPQAIERSVAAKAGVVGRDETETGERALLNLGHTFGHALEAWTGYSDRLLHGEGVAIGMCLAYRFSEIRGLCPAGTADRVEAHVARARLPTRISGISGAPAFDAATLVRLMHQDKKVRDGKLTFILARDVGDASIVPGIEDSEVVAFLEAEHAARP